MNNIRSLVGYSISDSLRNVVFSVLIYETIIVNRWTARAEAVEIIDVELICVYEDKAADIMLKVVACARILRYDTGG